MFLTKSLLQHIQVLAVSLPLTMSSFSVSPLPAFRPRGGQGDGQQQLCLIHVVAVYFDLSLAVAFLCLSPSYRSNFNRRHLSLSLSLSVLCRRLSCITPPLHIPLALHSDNGRQLQLLRKPCRLPVHLCNNIIINTIRALSSSARAW